MLVEDCKREAGGTLRATVAEWRFPMGYVTTDKNRDLSRHETLYEHPDAHELLSAGRKTIAVIEGGSSFEALGGLVTVILAIVGIARYAPFTMGGVCAIVIGASLFVQGGAIASRWRADLRRLDGVRYDRSELLGGVSTEVFGGVVGIVLGVLVLAGVLPAVLLPVAAIVFGGALLLGGAAQPELSNLAAPPRHATVQDAVEASGGIMVLVGVAAAVLGILSLLGVGPAITLALIAMLCIGGALLFAGGALATRFMRRFA
jgi:hypothetical protein